MTPDVGYYIPGFDVATFAHTFSGTFIVCVPTGIGLLILFYTLRRPMCFILPARHRQALVPLCNVTLTFGWRMSLGIVVSLLVGAWSHVVWDSFTHPSGWFVRHIEWLDHPALRFGSTVARTHYLLQQISTVSGAAVLIVVYLKWLRSRADPVSGKMDSDRWRYLLWAAILIISLVVSLSLAARAADHFRGYLGVRVFVFSTAVDFVSTATCLIVCSALIAWMRRPCGRKTLRDN